MPRPCERRYPRDRAYLAPLRVLALGIAAAGGAALATFALAPAGAFTPVTRIAATPAPYLLPVVAQTGPGLPSFPDIVDAVKPSVIGVRASASAPQNERPVPGAPTDQPGFFDPPANIPGPPDPSGRGPHQETVVSQGSGFFVSADGYAVTNRHVVEDNDIVQVKTDDGRSFTAKVVGTDAATDLALIKVDAGNDFVPVKLADHAPRVGEWVLAIGNPFGLDGTVTAGIVSSGKRNVGTGLQQDLIQIDAPVNQGNSGGPTFDVNGEVIGVNTMIVSPTGGSIGIAFAVPAGTLKKVVPQLKDQGFVARGWMGVQLQAVTPEIAETLKLDRARGALVGGVQADGPAAAAGLTTGDIVESLNGEGIDNGQDLARKVGDLRPGTTVKLGIRRAGEVKEVAVTLGELPAKREVRINKESKNDATATPGLGLRLAPAEHRAERAVSRSNAPPNADERGVRIVGIEPTGSATLHGLAVGDVITQVDGKAVSTPAEFQDALSKARSDGKRFSLLQLKSGDATRFVAVPPDPA